MAEVVHVVGEVSAGDLRARSVGVLCGERIPWHGAHYRLTGLVGEAEVARWLELVTCEACKAALAQEALQAAG